MQPKCLSAADQIIMCIVIYSLLSGRVVLAVYMVDCTLNSYIGYVHMHMI